MPTIRIDRTLSVRTFRAPPQSFDPRRASAATLDRYGIPARPAGAPLAEVWDEAMSAGFEVVQPQFRLGEEAALSFADIAHAHEGTAARNTNFIAGAEAHIAESIGTLRWVEATWTIPNVYPAATGATYSCAPWVGLAGPGVSLQAGWYATTRYANTQLRREFFTWWRWAPNRTVWLDNFPVVPGDLLSCVICLELESSVKARIYLQNVTSRKVTTFLVTAPAGTQLEANTAGWLVQAERFDGGRRLARMGAVYFDRCNAGLMSGPGIFHPTNPVHMTTEDGSEHVAFGNILTDTMVAVRYAGP